jgi:TetR/AcrR family transcriptional repressor of mexJK operon
MQVAKVGRPKSQEKRHAIMMAAVDLFLANGFKETSMEEVARLSGVSKQTVYSHFQNKEALFSAVISSKCQEHSINMADLADHEGCLEKALTLVCTRFLALFQDDDVVSMFAIIIAEARNAPRVAELFYEAGPLASLNALAGIVNELSEKQLGPDNARLLSMDFYSFVKGHWHMRSLMNLDYKLDEAQRKEHVQRVVSKTLCLLKHHYS